MSKPRPIAGTPLPPGAAAAATAPSPLQGGSAVLLEAVRQALRTGGRDQPERVALLLGGGAVPHRRRVLKVMLQDAAMAGGGQVHETAAGELLLLGTSAAGGVRLQQVLAGMAGGAAPGTLWQLPSDGAPLLHWAGTAQPVALPPGAALPPPADVAGLDARVDALRPEALARRQALLRLARAGHAVAGMRLALSTPLLAAELGPLAADPDLLAHAADRLATRLPALADDPALTGAELLLLPLPRRGPPPPALRFGLVGVLPLAEAANPARLQARRAELDEAGWQLAIGGLDAAALGLLLPAALPADLLLLQWSPALAAPGAAAALARIDPSRLVLLGCDTPESLVWGAGRGITLLAGQHVEALLAAVRLAGCPRAAECSARQCGERSVALAPAARIGCGNPALLDAMLPAEGFAVLGAAA